MYPVLLKAANGGGGKGQRVVRKEEELEDGFKKCKQEAEMSFGDGSLFLVRHLRPDRKLY